VSDVEQWCPNGFWEIASPLIPEAPRPAQGGGRRRTDDRAVLAAILYLAQAGCSWWKLPAHHFGTTRSTAHRRFTEWTRARLWERLHVAVLDRLNGRGEIDFDRAVIDSVHVRAVKGGL
jgi:transposase